MPLVKLNFLPQWPAGAAAPAGGPAGGDRAGDGGPARARAGRVYSENNSLEPRILELLNFDIDTFGKLQWLSHLN